MLQKTFILVIYTSLVVQGFIVPWCKECYGRGGFLKRRSNTYLNAKKNRAKTENTRILNIVEENSSTSPDLDESLRARLKAELASPLRPIRKYAYFSIGAAAGLSLFISLPQLLFAIQDSSENLPNILTNCGINLAGVVVAAVLAYKENQSEQEQVAKFTEKESQMSNRLSSTQLNAAENKISLLPVEIQSSEVDGSSTRIVSFRDLQIKGKQNVVIFAGEYSTVRDALITAKIEGNSLFSDSNTFVVPVVLGKAESIAEGSPATVSQLEDEPSKGFGAPKEGLMTAPYISKPAQIDVWLAYLQEEVEQATSQGTKDITKQGIVLGVNRNGKVARRGVGLPPWKQLIQEIEVSTK